MKVWRYVSYDVWGNAEDGFEVNQTFTTPLRVELPDDFTRDDLLAALRDQLDWSFADGAVDVHEDTIYLACSINGRPEGEFVL